MAGFTTPRMFAEYCPDSESWDTFIERFECFLQAQDLTNLSTDRKRGFFLSSCGPEMFSTARALVAPTPVHAVNWELLLNKLKGHYAPTPSRFAKRHAFRRCLQREDQTINQYIASLRASAVHCEFADLEESLLEQFIYGVYDNRLQRRLLSRSELTLQLAVDEARASEMAERTTSVLQKFQQGFADFTKSSSVHHQNAKKEEERNCEASADVSRLRATNRRAEPQFINGRNCFCCGGKHLRSQCKLKNSICRRCNKKGHLAAVCRAPAPCPAPNNGQFNQQRHEGVFTAQEEIDCLSDKGNELETWTVSSASVNQQATSKIHLTVRIEGQECNMEVDTGSAKTIVSWATMKKIVPTIQQNQLHHCPCRLQDYQGNIIPVMGWGKFHVHYKKFEGQLPLIVVARPLVSLLGMDWFNIMGFSIEGIDHLESPAAEQEFSGLLNEFAEVFDGSLGCYTGNPISLNLDPMVGAIRLKARRVPLALKGKVDAEIDKLLAQGVLEPVDHAPWETPIVIPVKPDGSLRLCGDFKSTINKALQAHPYPVPVVQHVLHSLGQGKIFAKLDLAQAYQQLPVDDATALAQTIVTHRGAFKCKRLQFGVCVAPGLFQSLMERLLHGIPGVVPYFDDVMIAATDKKELTVKLRQVFSIFKKAGLKLKNAKCKLGVQSVDFLGFRIDKHGIHPTQSKIEAIAAAPTPKSKADLQAFLGLLNFYSVFLPHKATVAEPLHRLMDNKAPWVWTDREASAFVAVKQLLTSSAVLVQYSERFPLTLACDASPFGVGAVLSHILPSGQEAPIAFYSRTLSKTERNYSQLDKEALAAVAGVKRFHYYLYGRYFQLITDHKPLLGIIAGDKPTPQILSPRMLRWTEFLNSYNYTLEYRPGKDIGHADALSRCPLAKRVEDPSPAASNFLLEDHNNIISAIEVAIYSKKDRVISQVLNWVQRGWPHRPLAPEFIPFLRRRTELSELQGCLLWGNRVIIPTELQHSVLTRLHEGHPGIVRMKALGRSYAWWPNMDEDITKWVQGCQSCQQSRPVLPKAPVQEWDIPRSPWSRIHIDFAGPLEGHIFLLVIVDALSKWIEVCTMQSINSDATIKALEKLFATHGLPDTIVSDNGPQFTSASFQTYVASLGIRQVFVAPYHPAGNGLAERAVRSVKDALNRLKSGSLARRINTFLLTQHITPCHVTGKSPAEILMGRRLRVTLDRLHPDYTASGYRGDQGVNRSFNTGDQVFAQNFSGEPKWIPGYITSVTGPCSYRVQLLDGRQWRRHVNQLRRRNSDGPSLAPTPTEVVEDSRPDVRGRYKNPVQSPVLFQTPNSTLPLDSPLVGHQVPGVEQSEIPLPENIDTQSRIRPDTELRRSERVRRRPAYLSEYACAVQGEGVLSPGTFNLRMSERLARPARRRKV